MDGFFAAMFLTAEQHDLNPIALRYWPLLDKARQDSYRKVMAKGGLDPDLKE